jgi:hypothetical protein
MVSARQPGEAACRCSGSPLHPPFCQAVLVIKTSSVPGGGLGVYLSEDSASVPPGTVLTTYGGKMVRLREIEGPMAHYAYTLPGDPDHVWAESPWNQPVPTRVQVSVGGVEVMIMMTVSARGWVNLNTTQNGPAWQ